MTIAKKDFTTQLLIDAGISAGMRVLDVGCGSGDVAFLLGSLVGSTGEVIGIDHDADALASARKRIAAPEQALPVSSKAACSTSRQPWGHLTRL
jgi:ubiquinone/menaquinone biosynthesis C-methylase UbiE